MARRSGQITKLLTNPLVVVPLIFLFVFTRLKDGLKNLFSDTPTKQEMKDVFEARHKKYVNPKRLSMPLESYDAMADALFRAMDGFGTDNYTVVGIPDSILNPFYKNDVEAEAIALHNAFGMRSNTMFGLNLGWGTLMDWYNMEIPKDSKYYKELKELYKGTGLWIES